MLIQDLISKDYAIWDEDKPISRSAVIEKECDYIITLGREFRVYTRAAILSAFVSYQCAEIFLSQVQNEDITIISVLDDMGALGDIPTRLALVVNQSNRPLGIIQGVAAIAKVTKSMRRELWSRELQIDFYHRIFSAIEDEIFLTDEYGFIQYMNPRAEEICEIELADCLGHHVRELVKAGYLSTSKTMEVLETKKRATGIMKMKSGRMILASSLPVFGDDGKITHVLSTSKDVKEINELIEKIESISQELNTKDKEIADLQERVVNHLNYVMESEPMQEVRRTIARIAATNVSVLIDGESGTGKEVVADLIYRLSNRRDAPMMKINCGLISKDLLETELFGYEAGAFTGALKGGKKGKIEVANGGTVFFDEIGELPLNLQVKLLEFLQERQFTRVGGTKKIKVDVRIIAATNRNLKEMVKNDLFREDLFYRLDVMPIHLLPLKKRREDIIPLTKMFLQKFNYEYGHSKTFNPSALYALCDYDWPGNVRELQHTVERLVVALENDVIGDRDVEEFLSEQASGDPIIFCTGLKPLKEAKKSLETALVERAYGKCGNTYDAAKLLQVNQSTIVRILNKHKT